MFVDSHCHIDGERFSDDLEEVLQNARDAGISAMLNVGTGSPESSSFETTVNLAEANDDIYAAVGIHPHDAAEYSEEVELRLKRLTESAKVIAWGEIGLDYHYDHSPRETQKKVFRRQVEVARDLDLPIIIHSRSANDDTVQILRETCSNSSFKGGIMHCFGGTPEMAETLMALGFMISFAGNVTFKNAEDLRESARVVPLEKLLVETDCPYLTPVPFRGRRNEPKYVVETARFLADFYDIPVDTLAAHTSRNFFDFFGIE